jgi:HlyD family secretion protein
MSMKKFIVVLIVLIAVAGAGYGVYTYRKTGPEVQVTTLPVSRGDISHSVSATGTLEAVRTVTVGSQVSGIVKELNADFNEIVKKGQVIARLDPALFQTQIEQQEANLVRSQTEVDRLIVSLDDAKVKLKRAEGLAAKNLAPAQDLETAQVNVRQVDAQLKSSRASYTQSQAALNQAKVNLDNTIITAPITGIVIQRSVDVGQTVAASMNAPTLFLIAEDLTKMQARASVDEADVGMIRPGQTARFRVDAYPTDNFTGIVRQVRLQPTVVQNVVTYISVIDVPNPDYKLKPGMTANVTIEIARRTNALRVPNSAIRFRPTSEMFLALNQPLPPEMTQQGRGGRNGARGQGNQGAGGQAGRQGADQGPAAQAQAAPGAATGRAGAAATVPGAQVQPGPQGRQAQQAVGDPPAGRTGGRGGQGGGAMDPEARARFQERMANMTPEERAQMQQRFGNRQGAGGTRADQQGGTRQGGPNQPAPVAVTTAAGQTIDSLFGPLPTVISSARVYLYIDKQMKLARIRTGISDGTYTELIGEELKEGQELVTDVSTGQARAQNPAFPGQQRPGQSTNPMLPGGGRGMGGPGGPR